MNYQRALEYMQEGYYVQYQDQIFTILQNKMYSIVNGVAQQCHFLSTDYMLTDKWELTPDSAHKLIKKGAQNSLNVLEEYLTDPTLRGLSAETHSGLIVKAARDLVKDLRKWGVLNESTD